MAVGTLDAIGEHVSDRHRTTTGGAPSDRDVIVIGATTGNDLQLSNIADPQLPTNTSVSDFNVPPYGDYDYNLREFAVCDDCRFGSADGMPDSHLFYLVDGRYRYIHTLSVNTSDEPIDYSGFAPPGEEE